MITLTLPYPISARFGSLFVISRAANDRFGRTQWNCRCDCGKEHVAALFRMTSGHTKSCGCARGRAPVHGMKKTRTYNSWCAMKARCSNPKNEQFCRYGARGVVVCDRWATSFECFLADMGERPAGTTIDRIDNGQGYLPGNCRWASHREQRMNQERMK